MDVSEICSITTGESRYKLAFYLGGKSSKTLNLNFFHHKTQKDLSALKKKDSKVTTEVKKFKNT
jgi:hypothetical protein